jgi:peptidoglycan/LPS O-acetylase OafA/YrhL
VSKTGDSSLDSFKVSNGLLPAENRAMQLAEKTAMTKTVKAKFIWFLRSPLHCFDGSKGDETESFRPNTADALLPGLELIRGLACLQVFFSHIFIVLMLHSRVKINPSFWKLAVLDWSYQSVMVFFVLSGYVIALSQQRKQQDFFSFMRSRFCRLEPLYLVVLVLSFGLESLFYPSPAYDKLLGHLVFIQGSSLAPVFSTNAPLWSLGCEFFFYLTFAFTIGRNQKLLNIGWFILGLGAIVLNLAGVIAPGLPGYFQNILALSPVWLLGTFLINRPLYAGGKIAQHLLLFGMLPLATHSLHFLGSFNSPARSLVMGLMVVPLLCTATQTEPVRSPSRPFNWIILFGLYFLLAGSLLGGNQKLHNHTETLFALGAPFLFLCLVPLYRLIFCKTLFFTPRVTFFSLGIGKMSYAIYIIHFPILIALGTIELNPLLQIVADIGLVFPVAWLLSYRLQPVLAAVFDRLWPAIPTANVKANYQINS